MILVCPSCSANFKIPDGAIPPEGRKVRCAKCKHSWHATPKQVLKPQPQARPAPVRRPVPPVGGRVPPAAARSMVADDAGLAARTAQMRRTLDEAPPPPPAHMDDPFDDEGPRPAAAKKPAAADFEPGDDFGVGAVLREKLAHDAVEEDFEHDRAREETDPDGDDYDDAEDGEAYDEDDFLARRRAEQRRDAERGALARQRRIVTVGWALLMVFILSVLYVLVFMQDTLKESWPASRGFYSLFEGSSDIERFRPAEGETLTKPITEEEVYVRASLDPPTVEEREGQMALVLRGYVENTGNRAANVPRLLIEIKDGRGRVLDSWTFDPPGLVIRRGAKLAFEQSRSPIPTGAATAEVKVLEGTKSSTEAAEAP
ncbi:MAG: hypothetical protein EP335_15095 [Alphaproteobacteria bacterium]|nr:MAG: hypothetical protein EP335_15095 [Alphaproteobacteria bacterium]